LILLKGVKIENRVTHEIFMIIRPHGLLLFKISVSVLVQALQGDDEIKRLLETQKVTKLHISKAPKNLKGGQICKNYYHGHSYLLMAGLIAVQKRSIFRTPEKLGGLEKIPDFCTPCDEIKPIFSTLIRHLFQKI
jgi:hypothetical protein